MWKPYSRSNSRSDSRNWWDAKISAQILGAFFSKLGWFPRARTFHFSSDHDDHGKMTTLQVYWHRCCQKINDKLNACVLSQCSCRALAIFTSSCTKRNHTSVWEWRAPLWQVKFQNPLCILWKLVWRHGLCTIKPASHRVTGAGSAERTETISLLTCSFYFSSCSLLEFLVCSNVLKPPMSTNRLSMKVVFLWKPNSADKHFLDTWASLKFITYPCGAVNARCSPASCVPSAAPLAWLAILYPLQVHRPTCRFAGNPPLSAS